MDFGIYGVWEVASYEVTMLPSLKVAKPPSYEVRGIGGYRVTKFVIS